MNLAGKKCAVYFYILICVISIIFTPVSFLAAVTIEEALDNDISKSSLNDEDSTLSLKTGVKWEISGFLESNNQFYLPDEKFDEATNYGIIMLESHGRLNAKYGSDSYFGKAIIDAYFYPDVNLNASAWAPPRESGSIEARELYFKGGKDIQFKIGKQLFSWGAADMFQITNYLDRQDQREFFSADSDGRYDGVPALSLKYLYRNYSIELAGTPVHNPALMPDQGSYWFYNPASDGSISIVFSENEKLPVTINNGSFAVRAGGTVSDLDFHISYFNGINTNLTYKPELAFDASSIYIDLRPYYDRIQSFGLDLAFTIEKLSLRGEALYSYDMIAVKNINAVALQTGIIEIMGMGYTDEEIAPVKRAPYFAYAAGADYNLWGSNGLVLVEWMQGLYLKDRNDYIEPVINKMLLVRVQDKFLNESLEAEAGTIMRPINKNFGYAITGKVGWNFKNGLTVSTGAIVFTGKDDELFSNFDDKDLFYLKARMAF